MDGDPDQVEQETFDEGVLSQRLQLAAEAHGLGSAIGWFHGSGRQMAKNILGIPLERLVRTALSFGYEDAGAEGAALTPLRPGSHSPKSSITSDSAECEPQGRGTDGTMNFTRDLPSILAVSHVSLRC